MLECANLNQIQDLCKQKGTEVAKVEFRPGAMWRISTGSGNTYLVETFDNKGRACIVNVREGKKAMVDLIIADCDGPLMYRMASGLGNTSRVSVIEAL